MSDIIDMPPAGGEVEVLPRPIDTKHLGTNACVRAYGWNDCHKEFLPIVTRLQADLASANADKEAYGQNAIDLRKQRDVLKAEVATARKQAYDAGFDTGFANGKEQGTRDAESELTKALELLRDINEAPGGSQFRKDIDNFLAHQSAPAAKGDKCSDGGQCGLGGFCTNCHNLP